MQEDRKEERGEAEDVRQGEVDGTAGDEVSLGKKRGWPVIRQTDNTCTQHAKCCDLS